MQRQLLPALLVVLIGASTAMAQDWARKMFSVSSHDFGTVARGAKVEYRFQFNNPYKETVHVASVWSSCGCTSPEVTKATLKTYDKSEIVAKFNTRTFTGNHSATLHVVIDKPFNAEVLLNVWGDIRGDLQVEPEQVEFGTIDQGQAVDRKLTVTHSGSSNWKILDVRSVNTNYEVEVKPGPKSYGQVSYDLFVHLKKDTPPGYLKDQLILVTNDSRVTQFPIEVEGLVKAELSASPQSLAFGLVEPGKTATKFDRVARQAAVQDHGRALRRRRLHIQAAHGRGPRANLAGDVHRPRQVGKDRQEDSDRDRSGQELHGRSGRTSGSHRLASRRDGARDQGRPCRSGQSDRSAAGDWKTGGWEVGGWEVGGWKVGGWQPGDWRSGDWQDRRPERAFAGSGSRKALSFEDRRRRWAAHRPEDRFDSCGCFVAHDRRQAANALVE